MTTVEVWAPAKINLTLHVTGQRADGYHELDGLVAFAPAADKLVIQEGNTLSLTVEGPEAGGVPADMSNLVMRVADRMAGGRGASLSLTKHLPAAAGIGGGSSDAAAALRGLLAFWNSEVDLDAMITADAENVKRRWQWLVGLGADLLMCLHPAPQRIGGIGDKIAFVDLPPLPAVLVNPRVAVSTPDVFKRLKSRDNAPMPERLPGFADTSALIDWLGTQRNDLEYPAREIAPVIDTVLADIAATPHCGLSRMSGSGATCFGLFPNEEAAQAATEQLAADHPDWWVAGGNLGSWVGRAAPNVR